MAAALALLTLGLPGLADAQFLRVGPFDFSAKVRTGAVWSDNIEGERPSERVEQGRDYFVYGGLDLRSEAAMSGDGRVVIDTGFTVEKHFLRKDLDNSENPLGRFRAEAKKNMGRLELNAFYSWERSSESSDIVIPGVSGKTRNPKETTEYGWGGKWKGGRGLTLGADYDMLQDRFDKEQFKPQDKDTETITYFGSWQFRPKLRLEYEMEYEREAYVNETDPNDDWRATETIKLDWDADFWRRPKVTFSFGVEREDETDKKGHWEPIYEVKVQDVWDISSRLKLAYQATYTYEDNYEEDDIAFVYDVTLEHLINARTTQKVKLNREPRRTLGSTEDSDKTTWSYELKFDDVLVPNLSLGGMVSYEVTVPPDPPTERVWIYQVKLQHLRQVTSRLKRALIYTYDAEDSNIEDEWLIENRVEWNYVYDL